MEKYDSIYMAKGANVEENEVDSAGIFKLNADCFEKIFDYSPLRSLIRMGATCKWLQQLAGEYFRQNYNNIKIIGSEHEIKIENRFNNINHFSSFIRRIHVTCNNLRWLQSNCFQSLIEIEFYEMRITSVECLQKILCQIEVIKFGFCRVDNDFHEMILKFCKNIKRLYLRECESGNNLIGSSNNWLLKKFATLEHFEVRSCSSQRLEELKLFLESNPTIQKFAINSNFFNINRNVLLATDVKLNSLSIDYDPVHSSRVDNPFYTTLSELSERKFYKKLNFYCKQPYGLYNGEHEHTFSSLNSCIKLHVITFEIPIDLSTTTDLEEFCVPNISHVIGFDQLENLTNLQRISISHAKPDDILPFISHAKKLKKINITHFHIGTHFNPRTNLLDLTLFNKEREKLPNASKISIYVEEYVYLNTKRVMGSNIFRFVEIKRIESCDLDHDFSYFYK